MAGPDRMGNLYADEGADPRIHSAPKSRHLANVLPGESTLACSDPLIEPSARKPSTRAHCTLEVVPRSEFRTTSRNPAPANRGFLQGAEFPRLHKTEGPPG